VPPGFVLVVFCAQKRVLADMTLLDGIAFSLEALRKGGTVPWRGMLPPHVSVQVKSGETNVAGFTFVTP